MAASPEMPVKCAETGDDQRRINSPVVSGRQQFEQLFWSWFDYLDAYLLAGTQWARSHGRAVSSCRLPVTDPPLGRQPESSGVKRRV
jgi:hypothetical protein